MARPSLRVVALLAALASCSGERHVNPPPEGEWLEWEPKPTEQRKKSEPLPEPKSAKKGATASKHDDGAEDLDAPPPKAKPSAPVVKCNARDLTRESLCIALSELGAKECPGKLPNRAEAKEAGSFEAPPKGAKRDPSLEASVKQCCYAWCGKIPAAAPPVPCKSPEPLFCFESPLSTQNAAPPPYADCPMGLRKTQAKGRRKPTPSAAFSSKLTKEERNGEPRACCYQACK